MVNKYCQKLKERLRKEALGTYQNLSEEGKDKRGKSAWKRYQNITEEVKERGQYYQERKKKLPDYRRNYYLSRNI